MTSNISVPVVLIADDLPGVIQGWESALSEYGIGAISATTIRELCVQFLAHEHEIAAIIIDGCMPGDSLNTIPFIQLARGLGFIRPIIASSSSPKYREWMLRAGCSHEAPKHEAATLAAELLSKPI